MILMRQGSKKSTAEKIIKYFPKHNTYIEPFFGAGGLFFNKPKVKYNIMNDIDNEVFNFWKVLKFESDAFYDLIYETPYHSEILEYYKNANISSLSNLERAVRLIFLSNYTYLGSGTTIRLGINNEKKMILERINDTVKLLSDVKFFCSDYKKFIKSITYNDGGKNDAFIYCDPPYLSTTQRYNALKWNIDNFIELLDFLIKYKVRFAISEFDNKDVINEAFNKKLNVFSINERRNLKNRRVEILITNYKNYPTLFD